MPPFNRSNGQHVAGAKAQAVHQPACRLDDPCTELYVGDCRKVLASMSDASADLAITDPPYNLNLHYNGQYDDDQAPEDYLGMLEEAMRQTYRVLSPTGSLFLIM